jgi:transcriptional regulator with XRE-family HTH domain
MKQKKHPTAAAARLAALLTAKQVTISELAKLVNYTSPNAIYYILGGRNGIGVALSRKICKVYQDISIEWLISGDGNMFITPKNLEINQLWAEIQELRMEITELKKNFESY